MEVKVSYIAFDAEYISNPHRLTPLVFDGRYITEREHESFYLHNSFNTEEEAVTKITEFMNKPTGRYGYKSILGDCHFFLLKKYIIS